MSIGVLLIEWSTIGISYRIIYNYLIIYSTMSNILRFIHICQLFSPVKMLSSLFVRDALC
jgi:hypothetical protein